MTVAIPPSTVLGPIEAKLPDLVARVASNLHADAADEWVMSAVDAAVAYVIDYSNRNEIGLPDDALTMNGLVGFATRIYQDGFSPNGVNVAIGDPMFTPTFSPEHLFKHWRHYFLRLYPKWGIA